MAIFSYEIVGTTSAPCLSYQISGLDNTWVSYVQGGLITQPFVSGCYYTDVPASAVKNVISGGSQRIYPSTTETFAGAYSFRDWTYLYNLGTGEITPLTVYPFCNYNGYLYGVTTTGSVPSGQTVPGIYINPSSAVRPGYFYWANYGSEPPNSTSVLWIPKAAAWNGLRYNIAQLLAYKGLISSADSFYDSALPIVSRGTPPTAAMYNQAAYYINYMHGGEYLSYVEAGVTPMSAYYWYQLEYYLNGIG